MDPTYEARLLARISERSGGIVNTDQVRAVFAVLRSFTRPPLPGNHVAIDAAPTACNRFLVGASGEDKIAILGLELALRREDALNLVTWITLVAAFNDDELATARLEALEGDR